MYLTATAMIIVGGLWVAACTWSRRMARAHVLALLLALWGIGLVATEVQPHVGFDKSAAVQPAAWACASRLTTATVR